MIYSQFITKVSKYLKSVRLLKNYVSFDMVFPETWTILKSPQRVEVIKEQDNKIISFVCQNESEVIDETETYLDSVIKYNIEKEEKDRLFKTKVMELKNIFEREKLENLKGLKFDVEEIQSLLEMNTDSDDKEEKTEKGSEQPTTSRKRTEPA